MSHELRVGFISIIGLIMMAVIVVYFYALDSVSIYSVTVEFDNIRGMQSGDKVYFSGIRAGKISHLEYSGARIYAQLSIDSVLNLPENPIFRVETMGLMGETFIGVSQGSLSTIENNEYSVQITGHRSNISIGEVLELSGDDKKVLFKVVSLPRFRKVKEGIFLSEDMIVTVVTGVFGKGQTVNIEDELEWKGVKVNVIGGHYKGEASFSANDLISRGEDLIDGLKGTVSRFNSFLEKTDRIVGKIDKSIQGITIESVVNKSVNNLNNILSNMEKASENISNFTSDLSGMTGEVSSMLSNFEALSADLRKESKHIAENLSLITENVKLKNNEISSLIENLEKFSSNITELAEKSTPRVENTLKNVDSVVHEVKNMIETVSDGGKSAIKIKETIDDFSKVGSDVRSIAQDTRDAVDKADLKATAGKITEISSTVSEIIEGIKGIEANAKVQVRYNDKLSQVRSDLSVEFSGADKSRFYRIGAEGIGKEDLLNLQMGYKYGKWGSRFGIFDSKIGAGIDYFLFPDFSLGFEVKDIEDTVIDLNGDYQFKNYGFYFKGRDVGSKVEDSSLDVGIYRILK